MPFHSTSYIFCHFRMKLYLWFFASFCIILYHSQSIEKPLVSRKTVLFHHLTYFFIISNIFASAYRMRTWYAKRRAGVIPALFLLVLYMLCTLFLYNQCYLHPSQNNMVAMNHKTSDIDSICLYPFSGFPLCQILR